MTNNKLFDIRERNDKFSKDDVADIKEFRKSISLLICSLFEHDFPTASVVLGDIESNLNLRLHITGEARNKFLLDAHTLIGKIGIFEEHPDYSAAKSALKTAKNCRELGIAISDEEISRLQAEVERTRLLPRSCVKNLTTKSVTAFINQFMVLYAAQYCGEVTKLEDIAALEAKRREERQAARRAARAAKKAANA